MEAQKIFTIGGKEYYSVSGYADRIGVSYSTAIRMSRKKEFRKAIVTHGERKLIDPEVADEIRGVVENPANELYSHKMLNGETKTKTKTETKTATKKEPITDPEVETVKTPKENYAENRAIREEYQSKLEKLKYEKAAGELVDRITVENEATSMGKVVREAVLSIPARVAAQLAAERDRHKVELLLETELRNALNGVYTQIQEERKK